MLDVLELYRIFHAKSKIYFKANIQTLYTKRETKPTKNFNGLMYLKSL